MINAMNQCKNFSLVLFNGIEIKPITNTEELEIMTDWLFENHQLDTSTVFHINKMGKYWCGLIEINGVMSIGFTFTKNKIKFHLLPPNISAGIMRVCPEEWSKIWLYDIRIQASVAILVKIIKDKYTHLIEDL